MSRFEFIFTGFLPMHTVNAPAFQSWLPSINSPVRRNIFWARFVSILNNNLCKSHLYFPSSTPRLCSRRGADDLARVGCINRAAGKPWRYPWSFSYLRLFTNWFANCNAYWQYFANSCTLWLEGQINGNSTFSRCLFLMDSFPNV